MRADSRSPDSCFFAVASYEHVLCSCSQLSWEIIIMAFYLSSPILWSVAAELTTKGGSRESVRKNGLWPKDELSLSTLLSLSVSLSVSLPISLRLDSICSFFPISPFLHMPGMPPIFPCSNYCLRKLCQRAEIVLMRGPAAFASVIWWISLGTHKTRHTRGYVATSEPRGR